MRLESLSKVCCSKFH